MIITVICKASTHIGLGHLIRSNSFINQVLQYDNDVIFNLVIIGDANLTNLIINRKINITTFENEEQFREN